MINNIDEFISEIRKIISEVTTEKTYTQKFKSRKPWMNLQTLKYIYEQNKYYSLKIKYPNNDFFNQKFKYFRNKVAYSCKHLKKQYYTNKYENATNSSSFWKITNEIIFNKTKNISPLKIITSNNNVITDCHSIANEFNNFFINISSINNTFISVNTNRNNSITNNQINCNFYLRRFNNTDVLNIINSLNKNSANGYDNIPMKYFQHFSNNLCSKLCSLINECTSTSNFPNVLKIAKVTPIYKSKSKTDLNNYRPISVLPALSKILEKAIQNQLIKYLDENRIINENQFGFVTKSSTLAACTQLINYIETAIDQNQFISCVFLDLKKAFDTVQHEILYNKLKTIGHTNKELKLFMSYHSNRKQYVKINDIDHDTKSTR